MKLICKIKGLQSCGVIPVAAALLVITSVFAQETVEKGATKPSKPPEPTQPLYGNYPDQFTIPLTNAQLPAGLTLPEITSSLPTSLITSTATPTDPKEQIFLLQQAFDLFAWQTFIALNWPADPHNYGQPDPNHTIGQKLHADRVWETFIPPELVFKVAAETPDPYEPAAPRPNQIHSTGKRTHLLNEVDEAFFNLEKPLPPIVDTYKEYVRYEVRINETEYDYIVNGATAGGAKYPLYSVQGQQALIQAGGKIKFPAGSIELKLAWKRMNKDKGDDLKKFFTQKVDVYENPYSDPVVVNKGVIYGLVGMHIMYIIDGVPQGVWPTFEHIDNVPLADLRETPHEITGEWFVDNAGNWKRGTVGDSYSFYNLGSDSSSGLSIGGFSPASRALMESINPRTTSSPDYYQKKDDRLSSQIAKVITNNNDIIVSKWTYALNAAMQAKLKAVDAKSPWSNYRLVTTQWPSNPKLTAKWEAYLASLDPPQRLGAGTIRAGNPAPVSLGNAVAETYMQINGSCMNCHSGATLGFDKIGQTKLGYKPDADFSFMLQRAHALPLKTAPTKNN